MDVMKTKMGILITSVASPTACEADVPLGGCPSDLHVLEPRENYMIQKPPTVGTIALRRPCVLTSLYRSTPFRVPVTGTVPETRKIVTKSNQK
jgi:hypothetical protein